MTPNPSTAVFALDAPAIVAARSACAERCSRAGKTLKVGVDAQTPPYAAEVKTR